MIAKAPVAEQGMRHTGRRDRSGPCSRPLLDATFPTAEHAGLAGPPCVTAGLFLLGVSVLNCAKRVTLFGGDLDECWLRPATSLCMCRLGNRSSEAGTALHGGAGAVGGTCL